MTGGGPWPPFLASYASKRQLICLGNFLASKHGPHFLGLVGGPVLNIAHARILKKIFSF